LAYMKRRCKSGAGLIITEIVEVHPLGATSPRALRVWDDKFIPGLRKFAAVVHAQGSKIAMQLHHCGRESVFQTKNKTAVAPSSIPSYRFGQFGTPREMTLDEIQNAILSFGAAALRAIAAGYDAVELHGAHGYLLMQFLSVHSNKRTDGYGGDFQARARFMIECAQEVRKQVGKEFPISLRISGQECLVNGYTIEDMQTIIPQLVNAGVDLINVSYGTHANAQVSIDTPAASAPAEYEQGFKVWLGRKIKDVTNVPVIVAGRLIDPYFMNDVIARGDADLVAVARQHLADPDFLKNAREGHPEDTCECIACNQGCIERLLYEQKSVRCSINPETGQEIIYPVGPTEMSRNVWVIGAGPAGLTAAFETARIGHRVKLFEKEQETGGQIRFAEKPPFKAAYGKWIRALTAKCKKNGVDIRTGIGVTEEMVLQGNPDAVILAIGADKGTCTADGITCSIVCDALQILSGEIEPKDHVVIIGGGLVGMETADFLCGKGVKPITLVEMLASSPVSPLTAHGIMVYRRLGDGGVKLMFNTNVRSIEEGSVVVCTDGKDQKIVPVSQVIVAVGFIPRHSLKEMLKKRNIRHFIIGDAREPRRIIEATTEGAEAAWKI